MSDPEAEQADDLALAHRLADLADGITLSRFRAQDLRVETKPDRTPVTDADREVERTLRQAIQQERRSDQVLGEEYGESGAESASRCWIIDPIDGTKNFLRGVPVWATLVAMRDGDEVRLGVVSAPALGRRWWASRGEGAWTGPTGAAAAGARPCTVSEVSTLADASLSYSSLTGWEEHGRLDRFLELTRQVWRTRAYGDFWSHMLVAEGAVEMSCEPEVSLWDLAALSVIVEEAGGRFTDLTGNPGPAGGSVLCSNGRLHDEVLALLQPVRPAAAG